jgi:hypothetical protein
LCLQREDAYLAAFEVGNYIRWKIAQWTVCNFLQHPGAVGAPTLNFRTSWLAISLVASSVMTVTFASLHPQTL